MYKGVVNSKVVDWRVGNSTMLVIIRRDTDTNKSNSPATVRPGFKTDATAFTTNYHHS